MTTETVERDVLDLIRELGETERDTKGALFAAVAAARTAGRTWPEIADALGVRPQSAAQRFGKR